jgi:alkylation response protein AidB-like acyl-CoA dehydrogenase
LTVDIALTPDQQDLVAYTRDFAASELALAPGQSDAAIEPRAFLALAGEQGWLGLGVAEQDGGLGGGLVELALVMEELGRVGAAGPIGVTAAFVRNPLSRTGNSALREKYLEQVIGGTLVGTCGLVGVGARDEWSPSTVCVSAGAGEDALSGELVLVPWALDADLLTVVARDASGAAALYLLPRDRAGIEVDGSATFSDDRKARVVLTEVPVTSDDLLAEGAEAERFVSEALDEAVLLQCAWVVGACEAALLLSVEYAKVREQFGRVIATYQSVSHRCADMRIAVDAARLLTWEAAWSLDTGAAAAVPIAKAFVDDTSHAVMVDAHQVHGAMGYSTEYPLQRLTRLIKAAQLTYGTTGRHLERIAEDLLSTR